MFVGHTTTKHSSTSAGKNSVLGMQELCLNNFGNNDGVKELSIIPAF